MCAPPALLNSRPILTSSALASLPLQRNHSYPPRTGKWISEGPAAFARPAHSGSLVSPIFACAQTLHPLTTPFSVAKTTSSRHCRPVFKPVMLAGSSFASVRCGRRFALMALRAHAHKFCTYAHIRSHYSLCCALYPYINLQSTASSLVRGYSIFARIWLGGYTYYISWVAFVTCSFCVFPGVVLVCRRPAARGRSHRG